MVGLLTGLFRLSKSLSRLDFSERLAVVRAGRGLTWGGGLTGFYYALRKGLSSFLIGCGTGLAG